MPRQSSRLLPRQGRGRDRSVPSALLLLLFLAHLAFAQSQVTPVTWSFAGPSGSTDRIIALAVDPRNSSVIYAAAPGGGIWKTQDAGIAWAPLFDSQSSLQVCSVAIDPRFPDVVYVGTGDGESPRGGQGVARSADGGLSWTAQARITNRPVCALAVDPTNSARVFAGSEEGLFVSSDSGATWAKVLAVPVTSIAFAGPGVVYAGMLGDDTPGAREHSLARSTDGGSTWTDLNLPRNSFATSAADWVRVITSSSEVFVVISYPSVPLSQLDFYSSNDGGNQWFGTFGIGQARPPMALIMDPNNKLYLAGAKLLLSGDLGTTWAVVPTKTVEFHAAAFSNGMLVLAGEKGFEPNLTPLPVAQILGISIDPSSRIWAGGPAGLFGLYPSSPFATIGVPGIGAVGRVTTVATNASTNVYAAGANQVYASTDGGTKFSSQNVIPTTELRAPYPPQVVDPVVPSSVYVAGSRVYHTTDSGGNWTPLSTVDADPTRVVVALAMPPAARTTLFAATACLPEVALISCPPISVVWRSTNSGQTWVQMSVVAGFVNRFAVDPRQSTRVYATIGAFPGGPSTSAGLSEGDLLLSTNAGGGWSSSLGNLPRTAINTVVIDPTSLPAQFTQPAQTLYVGTDSGVFASFDAGTRWMNISSGLPATPITDLALLQPDGILVASTFGRGVYRASVLGLAPGLIANPLSQTLSLMRGTTGNIGLALNNLSMSATIDWQLNALETWLGIPQPNGTIRPQVSAQIPISVSAVDLQTGTYVGRLQLTSAFGVQNVVVEAHVTPSPAQVTIAGGNDASGLPEAALPPFQVLVLDDNQAPLPGVPVTFAIVSGGGSLNARTVVTNASGMAAVILTLPSKPSTVQVVATSGALSVTFTATALAAPILLTDSIFDGVTFNANTSLGPGSILAILGQNLASSESVASNSLPTQLAATRALIGTANGDVALPLLSVSPSQIKALLPFDFTPGRYMLHTEAGALRSNDVEIFVAAFDPGIFTLNGSGRGPGIFIKDDGSIVTASNPADRNSRVSFFASGLGAVNPPIVAGQTGASAEPLNRTIQAPRVFFDRYSANVLYNGLAPGMADRYMITIQVPASVTPATNVSVSLTIGGFTSNRVTIPVR